MNINYRPQSWGINDIIAKSSNDATFLIPDLQRPYVWTPQQVVLLMDSIFRGWPFGSLLVWKVGSATYGENDGIPFRTFWNIVDRTIDEEGNAVLHMAQPAEYYMILDGQQRLQSLLLALGGDNWGFKLYDHDWAANLLDGRRMRRGRHWSKAALYFDVDSFQIELEKHHNNVSNIEVSNILQWVITDATTDVSPWPKPTTYIHPLQFYCNNREKYIRFWRLWNLVTNDQPERVYKEKIKTLLAQTPIKADRIELLSGHLAEFLKIIERIKLSANIETLEIAPFDSNQCSKDDYNEAIVNIFTRLNTAGRALTREEITLAWLKVGWLPALTGYHSAGDCINELKDCLSVLKESLDTDEVVRLISFIWSINHRDGKLLDAKDLLKGDVIRPMAANLSQDWNRLMSCINHAIRLIEERNYNSILGSFNAIIVAIAFYDLFHSSSENKQMSETERDNTAKTADAIFISFIDRWILGSEWANVWADITNFPKFADILYQQRKEIQPNSPIDYVLSCYQKAAQELLNYVIEKAETNVSLACENDRKKVYQYKSMLWIWHRLDKDRWQNSSIQLRIGKSAPKWEVDHTISANWWECKIKENVLAKNKLNADDNIPDEFSSQEEAIEFINRLGNCSLLEKNFNISKSNASMWSFLEKIYEFKEQKVTRKNWQDSMSMTDVLTAPESFTILELKQAIVSRDEQIKNELTEFLKGTRLRQDV